MKLTANSCDGLTKFAALDNESIDASKLGMCLVTYFPMIHLCFHSPELRKILSFEALPGSSVLGVPPDPLDFLQRLAVRKNDMKYGFAWTTEYGSREFIL